MTMERGGEGKGRAQEGKREQEEKRERRGKQPLLQWARPTWLLLGKCGEGHAWLVPGNYGGELRILKYSHFGLIEKRQVTERSDGEAGIGSS